MPMTDRSHQLAWAAGIVDGEGCIFIGAGVSLRVRVGVTNTDIRMIERLKELFGGNAAYRRRNDRNPNHKNIWDWEVAAKKAEACLKEVLPYLVCKRDQAELALLARSYVRRGSNSKTLE